MHREFAWWPAVNTTALAVVIIVLVGLFAGWPIYQYAILHSPSSDGSLNYLNGSSQIPSIANMPSLIDADTPEEVKTRTGFDGEEYRLVFSDEFNQDGRTFWPGDDMYWEGVDLNYWATKDLEWYDPDAITTEDGNLVITMDQEPSHGLNFRSDDFTGGYIEVSLSLPGKPTAQGFWPGVWTMGNLGRAGYGSSVDGMWPYSYDSCDVGTMPNQTWANGTGPDAALHSGSSDYGGSLSWLSGQRLSACTCPGEDHPGPSTSVGRGAPEIDILEGQIAPNGKQGSASQSIQVAPFDTGYNWKNSTPDTRTWDESITTQILAGTDQWHGEVTQESMSLNTLTDDTSFDGAGYTSYGYEYDPGPNGRITWAINGSQTWELNASAMGPDEEAQIGQRLVSEEPMYITLNLAISMKFQEPQWAKLDFPGKLRIDYVRVFQKGTPNLSCDPADHPTSQYIEDHLELYQNPNITVFRDSGFDTPKNSMGEGGCG
ncbi:family 16 glycoside hydrolase [Leucosporidium creatinivorum]|uniref:Family 16 glycoside hydrolase n=1 Tax=Leucosporidium creatinivorum TaxID=106004 RepID=A0A1Y2D7S3_9BASI|nr:family 16 glycoside hydrolase [Leucosporidium creatinivorum]